MQNSEEDVTPRPSVNNFTFRIEKLQNYIRDHTLIILIVVVVVVVAALGIGLRTPEPTQDLSSALAGGNYDHPGNSVYDAFPSVGQ